MDSISSTNNSKFQKKAPPKVIGDKDKKALSSTQTLDSVLEIQDEDSIELSPITKKALGELEGKLSKLFLKYPQYQKLIVNTEKNSSPLQTLAQIKAFLKNNPFNNLSAKNPNFTKFFQEVHALGAEYQATLHQYQRQMRSVGPTTYSKLSGS